MHFFLASIFLLLSGCSSLRPSTRSPAQTDPVDLTNYKKISDTEHFQIFQMVQDQTLAEEDISNISNKLESGFQKLAAYLEPNKSPREKLLVLLNGNSFSSGQVPRYPSVDDKATIRLYRFPGVGATYLQGLPHELVHAFRKDQIVLHEVQIGDFLKGYGFVEEAFAEFVSVTIDPTSVSFPNYGYPLSIVAGYWLSAGQDIPLSVLFNHHEINPKCVFQAYPLRASFFRYLNETYGKDKLFALAYDKSPYSEELFMQIYQKSFSELITVWRQKAMNDFKSFPNRDQLLEDYQSKTPLKYSPVCKAGTDW